MKFLADEMLKKTARWMRLIGLDTAYLEKVSDAKILEAAAKEEKELITKDEKLAEEAQKLGIGVLLLPQDGIENDLKRILEKYGLKPAFPEKTRCPECNGNLEQKKLEEVKEDVPAGSRESGERFWKCSSCGKVYWEGAHWENIKRVLAQIQEH
ncbi:MAG: Mut7-C RNAse domain-containing protein [Candidatus Micrarchaeia archaeon]